MTRERGFGLDTKQIMGGLKAIGLTAIFSTILLFGAAWIASGKEDPDIWITPLACVLFVLSTLFCGILSGFFCDGFGGTCFTGALYMVLLYGLSLLLHSSGICASGTSSWLSGGWKLLYWLGGYGLILVGALLPRLRKKASPSPQSLRARALRRYAAGH